MVYGMVTVDRSGRIVDRVVFRALGWTHGVQLRLDLVDEVLVVRREDGGNARVVVGPAVAIPAPLRVKLGLRPGDRALVAASPAHGVLLLVTVALLDRVLLNYWGRN